MNSLNISNQDDQDKIENVMAIVLSFMENSLNDASVYVEHSGRKVISKKDIKMALQAETFEYIHREDMEGSLLYYKESIKNDLEEYDEMDDINNINNMKDEEVDTFLQSKVVDDSEIEEYSKSLCKCNVCKRLNKAAYIWDNWEPQTDMEKILKKVIDTKI